MWPFSIKEPPIDFPPIVYEQCQKCGKVGNEWYLGAGLCPAKFMRRYCPSCDRHEGEAMHVVCPACGHQTIEPCRDAKKVAE
jgi:predicted RNA-binding Zn-ribbon protein involved in translation (DUF1610 family)